MFFNVLRAEAVSDINLVVSLVRQSLARVELDQVNGLPPSHLGHECLLEGRRLSWGGTPCYFPFWLHVFTLVLGHHLPPRTREFLGFEGLLCLAELGNAFGVTELPQRLLHRAPDLGVLLPVLGHDESLARTLSHRKLAKPQVVTLRSDSLCFPSGLPLISANLFPFIFHLL